MPAHYQAPFSRSWAELWSKLPPDTAISYQLSGLFHYAPAQGIEPDHVNDEVLDAFHSALAGESIVRDLQEIHRGAVKSWNNAAERIPGWPQQRLNFRSRREIFSRPWTAFPQSVAADIEAYLRRAAGLDLGDDYFTRVQRPRTLRIGVHNCASSPAHWSEAASPHRA